MDWKIAEAKNKLSEVVDRALQGEPQRVTRRDRAVIVIDENDYKSRTGECMTFNEFLKSGPKADDLELPSRKGKMREIGL